MILSIISFVLLIMFIICGLMVHYKTPYTAVHYGYLISGVGLLTTTILSYV